jgi:hypothetical protein
LHEGIDILDSPVVLGILLGVVGRRSIATGRLAILLDQHPVMAPDLPDNIAVPLAWVGYDETPIVYANNFLIQFQHEGSFVIGIGQATAPALTGTPEEIAAQAQDIEFIPVRPIARIAVTEDKLRELIQAMEANLQNFEHAKERLDPRGGDSK